MNTLKFFPRNSQLFRVLLIIKTSFDSSCNSSLGPTEAVSLRRDLFLKDVQFERIKTSANTCVLAQFIVHVVFLRRRVVFLSPKQEENSTVL